MKILVSSFLLLACVFWLWEGSAFCAGKKWSTYPNSSTIPPSKPQPISPGIEVPSDRAKLSWQVTSKSSGVATGDTKGAPAYYYSPNYGLNFVGFVPEGTEVKLEVMDVFGRVNFYRIPRPDTLIADERKVQKAAAPVAPKSNQPEFVWISGYYIVAK